MSISLRSLPAARVPLSALLLLVSFGCGGRELSLGEAIGLGQGGRTGSDAIGASAGGTANGVDLGGASYGGTPATSGAGAGSNDDGTSTGGAGAPATTGGTNSGRGGAAGDLGNDAGGTNPSPGGAPGAGDGGSINATGGVVTTGGSAALGGASGANSGGTPATGGKAASGGALATGGAKAASGGAPNATGGAPATGGTPATGGSETIGGCDRQLLANAEFDQGPTATWVETSTWPGAHIVTNRNDTKLTAEAVTPYSGDYLAWLGGIPDNQYDHHTLILTQKVAIPADAATLTLSGRRWVKTVEEASEVFDEAYLEFEGVDESVAWQALWLTNRDVTGSWVAFEASTDGLDAVRGKTITFVAYSRTDPVGKTSFFLDSLRLIATCGR